MSVLSANGQGSTVKSSPSPSTAVLSHNLGRKKMDPNPECLNLFLDSDAPQRDSGRVLPMNCLSGKRGALAPAPPVTVGATPRWCATPTMPRAMRPDITVICAGLQG